MRPAAGTDGSAMVVLGCGLMPTRYAVGGPGGAGGIEVEDGGLGSRAAGAENMVQAASRAKVDGLDTVLARFHMGPRLHSRQAVIYLYF